MSQEDHDLLVKIDTKLDVAINRVDDHEIRIRSLERHRWLWIGAATAAGMLADPILRMLGR